MLKVFQKTDIHFKPHTKLEEDLSDEFFPSQGNDSSLTLEADKELIRQALAVAFAGNDTIPGEPFMDWALSHHKFASQQERVDLVRFLISYGFLEDMKANSFQLCGQVKNEDGGTDDIVSVATVQAYDPKKHVKGPFFKLRHQWEFMVSTLKLMRTYKEELPPLIQAKEQKEDWKLVEKKTERWINEVDEWHVQYGPKGPHWYVHMVGCDPAVQGQGKGRQLLTKLCDMADKMGQDMYLEAGDRNAPFYAKFGFRVVGQVEFEDPQDKSNNFNCNLMTRTANRSN